MSSDIIVIDRFAPPSLIAAAVANLPPPDWPWWHRYTGAQGDKFATRDPERLHVSHQLLIQSMARLTVPGGEFPDLDLYGAGLHWIPQGGRLPRHYDSQRHPLKPWRRTRNAILYLTECSGGDLVILDHTSEETIRIVPPVAGRLVCFPCELPHEVCPVEHGDRASLCLFWWRLLTESEQRESLTTAATWL